jgi:hypothetical protein
MQLSDLGGDALKSVSEILGYLNFSSGAADPRFLRNLNELFARIETGSRGSLPAWQALGQVLREGAEQLRGSSDAFRLLEQAEAMLRLVFDAALPAYRKHHRDQLFHQTEEGLFRPFFVGRLCEAVLQQGPPWDQAERIVPQALSQLNDYLGHRPVAVLHTQQKIQPYAHEWVRPIPWYIRGAGVAVGRYQELIDRALRILEATEAAILFQACFPPELLDELAVDPRAYDFDHPNNKRPNYLFGQWDLQRLDLSGRSRRFVLQQLALDAILERVEHRGGPPREEVLFEAAAVLAGTMLMGAGVSGDRPDAHDSSVTLSTLVQKIAVYRDAFYQQLLGRLEGPHAERLRAEAVALRQPFGGARQHFNQLLARRRAEQLQQVHLAHVFAGLGCTEAAARHARVVPVASARMMCDIHCLITTAHLEIQHGRLEQAASLLGEIEDLLHRAIQCGAIVDPWNILGFGGQYSLFPSPENSVYDERVDDLIGLLGEIFAVYVQLQKEAAAAGQTALPKSLAERFERLVRWWDQFASCEVGEVEGISGRETQQSADHVAEALRAWHAAGTAAGDLAFWRGHAERFRSPKAYCLVIEALLERHDLVAAMALLVHWLSQVAEIPLVEENYSFHQLALLWMEELWQPAEHGAEGSGRRDITPSQRWALAKRFLDYLEANADEYWQVPRFALAGQPSAEADQPEDDAADEEQWDSPFQAAYEGVTYRDSTDDGFEGEILPGGESATDLELLHEGERLVSRLALLITLAKLWKLAAVASTPDSPTAPDRDDVLCGWLKQAAANRHDLRELLLAVHRYRIPRPRGTHESLVEYEHRRGIKETLLEQVVATCVETADAARLIRAAMHHRPPAGEAEAWEEPAGRVVHAALRGRRADVRRGCRELIDALQDQPLLYVALARGGNPLGVVASRSIQRALRLLLELLPRLGLLRQACRLLETVQRMEMDHPVGSGAITEFDQVFEVGCRAIVRCLVVSAQQWHAAKGAASLRRAEAHLIVCLEQAIEALLRCWLVHSRGVRLSALEIVHERNQWAALKRFIQRYGGDLFTQKFMSLGNLRAILHEGVGAYLQSLEEEPDAEEALQLLAELERGLPRAEAVHWLTVAVEAVVESYPEYVDYNSTTTQSDRGEMLYTLLDFLRLEASYDRVAWNLQPVVLAHEVLVRFGRQQAAEAWRKAVAERTATVAEDHLKRFAHLVKKYGMRLPSVAERLGERFLRPLEIDRLRALVQPAVEELRDGRPGVAFARLEEEIAMFTSEVTGAGFDLPSWLEALQQEVDRVQSQWPEDSETLEPLLRLPQVLLSPEEAQREVKAMLEG